MTRFVTSLSLVCCLMDASIHAQESTPAEAKQPAQNPAHVQARSIRAVVATPKPTTAATPVVAEAAGQSLSEPQTVTIEILAAVVVFDENGELSVPPHDVGQAREPDVLVAGALATHLAKQLNAAAESEDSTPSASTIQLNRLLRALAGTDRLEIVMRRRLKATNGQKAMLQQGARVPRIASTAMTSRGRTNQTVLENIGTLAQVQPRITDNKAVLVSLEFESSYFGLPSEGTPIVRTSDDQPAILAQRVNTWTLQTEVSAKDGETVVVCDDVHKSEAKVTEMFVLLTVHVTPQ